MDFCYFIGIDIAKETLDWAVYTKQGVQLTTHTPNTLAGIKTALAEFKALPDWNPTQAVFCMEHTATADREYLQRPLAGSASPKKDGNLVRILFADQAGRRDATAPADRRQDRQSRCPTGPPARHCPICVSLPRPNSPLGTAKRDYSETGLSDRAAVAVPLAND